MSAWYFVFNEQQQGPVEQGGLGELLLQGIVDEETLVWRDGIPEWAKLGDTELAEALPPAAKRRRVGGPCGSGRRAPDAALLSEIPGWVSALDGPSRLALFEKAIFTCLEDAIKGRPALRDALLTSYVQKHPASDDRDPAAYEFTDEFLLDAVEHDFDSREEMWEMLGAGNEEGAVADLIAASAGMDRRFCAELQSLALLSRARRLLGRQAGPQQQGPPPGEAGSAAAGGGGGSAEDAGQQLLALLESEPALGVARDMDGRSLWHDLVAAEREDLLRLLLPAALGGDRGEKAAAGAGSDGEPGEQQQAAAQGQADGEQQQAGAGRQQPNPLNLPDAKGSTPLHLAAEASQLELARLLIDSGANLDLQNRDPSKYASGEWNVKTQGLDYAIPVPSLHQTALHIAAEAGDLEMMQLLAERGALLNVRDTSGSTPLHLALEAQDERAVALLLKAGANPSLSSNDMGEDSTPLHAAASAGRPAILSALLHAWPADQLAAAVNQPGENGWTPLMLAARKGSEDCVRLLLERGANPAARNQQGKTAADIAAVNKRQAVAALLASWGGNGGPAEK